MNNLIMVDFLSPSVPEDLRVYKSILKKYPFGKKWINKGQSKIN